MSAVKVISGLALALIAINTGLYLFLVKPQLADAEVAAAFVSKKVCSCLNVVGLTEDQCRADFTDDVSVVTILPDARGVTTEVLGGFVSHRAVYKEGLGCTLVPSR